MRRSFIQTVIILAVLVVSALAASQMYELEEQKIYYLFQNDINERSHALEYELAKTRATLQHWKSFYEAIGEMNEHQFSLVAKDVIKSYPSLQLLGWAPLVLPHQRDTLEQQLQNRLPGFSIKEFDVKFVPNVDWDSKASVVDKQLFDVINTLDIKFLKTAILRPIHLPVIVLEPMSSANADFILGFDLLAVPSMKLDSNLMDSITSGSIIGLPTYPSPFSNKHEPVFMALVPILPTKNDFLAIPGIIKGFIASSFIIEDLLLSSSLVDFPDDIHFKLIDETGDGGLTNLYSTGEFNHNDANIFRQSVKRIFNREWTILALPKPGYLSARHTALPVAVFLAGTLFAIFLNYYFNLLQKRSQVVKELVKQRSQQLTVANEELNNTNLKLEKISQIDGLTGIANRRHFNDILSLEWNRAMREGASLTLLMIDVDYFKNYNDHYGHLKGDEVLRTVATELKKNFSRAGDLVARYGGEEFAVIITTTGGDSMHMADKCRLAVEALQIEHKNSMVSQHLTISIGLSSIVPNKNSDPKLLLESADKGLYVAKELSRNCVIYHSCHINTDSKPNTLHHKA